MFTAILIVYFIVELLMSHVTHSLTLLTDAYHTLYNIVGIMGFIIAMKMSHEHALKNTFGWARIGVLGMMVSTLALAALSFSVVVEALQTIVHASHSEVNATDASVDELALDDGPKQEVDAMHHPMEILFIGIIGIILNLVCFLVIGGLVHTPSFVSVDRDDIQVNVTVPQEVHSTSSKIWSQSKSVVKTTDIDPQKQRKWFLLDFCRDMSCSFLVIACAISVYMVKEEVAVYVDPAISILSVVIMMSTTYPFFKESGMILLQSVPSDMDVTSLITQLTKKFPSITNVHDLHIWRLTRTKVIATVHIRVTSPWAYTQIASAINDFFEKEGICLSTVQPEFEDTYENGSLSDGSECILRCRKGECQSRMCCKGPEEIGDIAETKLESNMELNEVLRPNDYEAEVQQSLLTESLPTNDSEAEVQTSLLESTAVKQIEERISTE